MEPHCHWKSARIVCCALAFATFVILLSCSAKDPIRIGFVAGSSGRGGDLGSSGRDAAQLAVEACNDSGGINGRPVQLLIKDDQQNPDFARQAVQALIDAGVVAIIGPMTSDMAVAVLPLLNQAHRVAVSPTVATPRLSGLDDYFFRVTPTLAAYAAKSANYQIDAGKMRRIVAIYDLGNRSYTESWLDSFNQVFSARGGTLLSRLGFSSGDDHRTFTAITHDLLDVAPDGVLVIANSVDSALLCQQIRKQSADLPITLADWGATEQLLELGGNAVEGVTVVQTFDRNSPALRYRTFRETYLARYHREPGFSGVYAYDASQVILTALRVQTHGQDLKKAISAVRGFEGLQSDFSFDAFGDVNRLHATISVIRDHQFVVVE